MLRPNRYCNRAEDPRPPAFRPGRLGRQLAGHPVLHAVRATKRQSSTAISPIPRGRTAPEFTDFTQHDPDDGKPGTMRTSVRIVYDDHAIYFGAKMTDPQRPSGAAGRRDTSSSAIFSPSISIRSTTASPATPSRSAGRRAGRHGPLQRHRRGPELGRRVGLGDEDRARWLGGRGADSVLAVAVSGKAGAVWGVNITRRTVRNNETVRIVNTRKGRQDSSRISPTSMDSKASIADVRWRSCRTAWRDRTAHARC